MAGSDHARPGPDGIPRCPWALSNDDYRRYHDEEWGRAVHGDVALFERFTLEAFQSGLSWLTILRKRPAFRRVFEGFDPYRVAAFGEADRARLLADTGLVRNRAKIDATVNNASALVRLWEGDGVGAFDRLVWSHRPTAERPAPRLQSDVATMTSESSALARAMRGLGFTFVGPTTAYAAMQACGVVDDHLVGCNSRAASPTGQRSAAIPDAR